MPPRRSYLICSVQRAGSWLLCHALQDTGVLAIPAEYFHRGDERFWRGQWKTATEDGFLQALRERPATANGVWGSKMMWNYFGDALARLRAWPRLALGPGAADPYVLAAAFPELRYVWLRRGDKLRQAISWWRAAATGQYALAGGDQPAPPPPFDRDALARLLRYAEDCEAGWGGLVHHPRHRPVRDRIRGHDPRTGHNRARAGHLPRRRAATRTYSRPPAAAPPGDQHTERLVDLFTARPERDRLSQWGDGTGSGRANVR